MDFDGALAAGLLAQPGYPCIHSVPLRLPEEIEVAVGDEMGVTVQEDRITISPSQGIRGRYRLEDLLAQIPEDCEPGEEDWGSPGGCEVW
jgi:antitoxin component of MazEF toxin-antitoxin module